MPHYVATGDAAVVNVIPGRRAFSSDVASRSRGILFVLLSVSIVVF